MQPPAGAQGSRADAVQPQPQAQPAVHTHSPGRARLARLVQGAHVPAEIHRRIVASSSGTDCLPLGRCTYPSRLRRRPHRPQARIHLHSTAR